jgi:prolyl-tRNA synthetase
MRLSHVFTKTKKDSPKDETSLNAQLLIKAGYVHKEMAGVYSLLPFGLKVNEKIKTVIRTHMDKIGGQEIHMSALQNPEIWKASNRWDDKVVDNWFKTKLKNDTELGLGFTHEEAITSMLKQHVNSYVDLPVFTYQFQQKFRNELRAKSGLMRGREFEMKDLYSFCKTEDEQKAFFEKAKEAYVSIYKNLGLGNSVYVTYASGGVFSKYSIEFQAISDAGEDTIYVDEEKKIAINKEIFSDEICAEFGIDPKKVVEKKSIEVGNIFNLGTRFADALELTYTDDKNQSQKVWMGSYGIGIGRLIGTIAELYADDAGLVWPKEVAPYQVIVVALQDDREVQDEAEKIYLALQKNGTEVLFHDKKGQVGEKLATADMLGIPTQIIVSKKALTEGKFEIKDRKTKQVTYKTFFDIVEGDLRG